MTQEQWQNLESGNVLQYERERYRLFCQDPLNRWICEVLDIYNDPMGLKLLKGKETQIDKFQLVL